MIDRRFLDSFLRINDISLDAGDAVITEALVDAKWRKDEIERALHILHSDGADGSDAVLIKAADFFRPEDGLDSDKLSRLLGVDVVVDPRHVRDPITRSVIRKGGVLFEVQMWSLIGLLALLFACAVLWFAFYAMEIGPYHITYSTQ